MRPVGRREMLKGMLGLAALAALPNPVMAAAETATLRALADRKGVKFGSAIDPELLDRPEYAKLLTDQCDIIVPRNSLKWNAIERAPGKFSFGDADKTVAFAEKNGLAVRGHTLVWYDSPEWVKQLASPSAVTEAVAQHISTTVSRYKGKIASWDVVNEPFEYDDAVLRPSVFLDQLGEKYMDFAFHAARAADPTAELVLNETHLYDSGAVYTAKRQAVIALIDRLQSRNVPIDGLGIQGHIRPGHDKIDRDGFAGFCKELKKRGVSTLITELDASCRFANRLPQFTPAEYAPPFGDLIAIAEANGTLSTVVVWGLSPFGLKPNETPGPNTACKYRINLFDDALQPLPSFDAVAQALSGGA